MKRSWIAVVVVGGIAVVAAACGGKSSTGAGQGGGTTSSSSGGSCPEPQQGECADLLDCCDSASFPAIAAQSVCRGLAGSCSSMCSDALAMYTSQGFCTVPDGGFPDGAAPDAAAPGCPLDFTPSNIAGADFCDHFPAPYDDIVISGTCTFEGTSSSSTCTPIGATYGFVEVSQGTGLPKIGVYIAKSWTISAGANVTVDNGNAIALVALDTIDVEGTISLSADGTGTSPGGHFYNGTKAGKGAGPGGGGAASAKNAGGGGGYCGAGGTGAAFSGGTVAAGGVTNGNAMLIPLVGGSSGGSADGVPGSGGGAIQLVANTSVTVGKTGVITVGGGSGAFADGAGSGGGILLESVMVTVNGILAANGGGGGGENPNIDGTNGNASATPAPGGTNGGAGSAGKTLAGGNGLCPAASCVSTNPSDSPGAGGGGAGWIRVNTKTGTMTFTGTQSPPLTTSCMTQGTITP
jgi:hypothetical protein